MRLTSLKDHDDNNPNWRGNVYITKKKPTSLDHKKPLAENSSPLKAKRKETCIFIKHLLSARHAAGHSVLL